MHIARARLALTLSLLALLAACARGPSRAEIVNAIRATQPSLDTATVYARVWQDGPPWFSCAEVIAKVGTPKDSAVVRNQVGNWRSLVEHGWIALRDSAAGVVADPGWCTVRPTVVGQPNMARWTPAPGPPFPTGQPRRGWTMPVGRQRLLVPHGATKSAPDSATVEYALTVAPNPDGEAVGAERDTTWFVAELRKVDGQWRMTASRRRTAGR